MRCRTFIASLPAAALIPTIAWAQSEKTFSGAASVQEQGGMAMPGRPANGFPPVWKSGEDRFVRPDVHAGDRPVGASFASRTVAYGLNGAAATAHPLATQAGIDILKAGGSAVDAAIAMNACLGFLQPTSSGIGGDAYAMIWDPRQKAVVGLAGSIALTKLD